MKGLLVDRFYEPFWISVISVGATSRSKLGGKLLRKLVFRSKLGGKLLRKLVLRSKLRGKLLRKLILRRKIGRELLRKWDPSMEELHGCLGKLSCCTGLNGSTVMLLVRGKYHFWEYTCSSPAH